MTDLFQSADQRKRERQLERHIAELELLVADFMGITSDLWNVRARGVKDRAKKLVPNLSRRRAA
jgi:hypothetical protein